MTAETDAPDPRIAALERTVADGFSVVLGDRFAALASHGSAVTGGYIPGFSDLDLVLFLQGAILEPDAAELQARLGDLDPAPFAYLQLSRALAIDDGQPLLPSLIPGSYRVLTGAIPAEGVLHTEQTLRASGRSWLARLPEAVTVNRIDWSVATGDARSRRIRVMMTALKPAIRALLVEAGEPVFATWNAPYSLMTELWMLNHPEAGRRLAALLPLLPPEAGREAAVGAEVLALLGLAVAEARGRGLC